MAAIAQMVDRAHIWHPITDMPVDFSEKAQTAEEELRALLNVWREQKSQFDEDQLDKFNRELNREWAIETGLIERTYEWDRGTTLLLIERGFIEALIPWQSDRNPAEVASMLRDHEHAIKSLFHFVEQNSEMTIGYIKQLHAQMLRGQEFVEGVDQFGKKTRVPLNHGAFKKRPNSPNTPEGELHEYCPPEHTDSEMERLVKMYNTHTTHPPLAQAAWLHHRFLQIHPFEDGNGRIARCLATLVFIREGLFPLVVLSEEKDDYIDTLQAADQDDLSPLICRFSECQKRYFVKALGIAGQVWDDTRREKMTVKQQRQTTPDAASVDEQIDSLAEFLTRKGQQQQIALAEKHHSVIKISETLHKTAYVRLQQAAEQITNKLSTNGTSWADTASMDDEKGHYYRHQIVEIAKKREYYANTDVHRSWVRLVLQVADERAMLLLFFHGIGRPYRGIIACSACFIMRRLTDGDERTWQEQEPIPLGDGVFQINYQESEDQATKRFALWLEEITQIFLTRAQKEF